MHYRPQGLKLLSVAICALLVGGCAGLPGPGADQPHPASAPGAQAPDSAAQPSGGSASEAQESIEAPGTPAREAPGSPISAASGQSSNASGADDLSPQSLSATAGQAAPAAMLKQMMAELQQVGALDPEAQARLMTDLQQTDPALWPLMVRQFRAALAYRQRSSAPGQTTGSLSEAAQHPAAISGQTAEAGPGNGPWPSTSPISGVPQPDGQPVWGDSAKGLVSVERAYYQPGGVRQASYQVSGGGQVNSSGQVCSSGQATRRDQASGSGTAGAQGMASVQGQGGTQGQLPTGAWGQSATAFSTPVESAEPRDRQEDWRAPLTSAILALESGLHGRGSETEDPADQARLRLLCLVAGQREGALRPIAGAKPAVQDFWIKQLYGLGTWLAVEREPDESRRAGEAKQSLGEALVRLGELAPLVVRNLAFCTEIQSFGCNTPFPSYEFAPGQAVLLYAEVDNFTSEPTPKGYHTALRSRYRIFDSQGRCVEDQDFTLTEEYCRNRRRDFFIGYHLSLPGQLAPGRYTLELTIEDLKSNKVGQSPIEFSIRAAAN